MEKLNIPIVDNDVEIKKFARDYAMKKGTVICSIFCLVMFIIFVIGYSIYDGNDYFEKSNPFITLIIILLLCYLAYSHLYRKGSLVSTF